MKTKIEVELKPFATPNFVCVKRNSGDIKDGDDNPASIAISKLSAETLEELCEQFTTDIFKKAAKRRPPQTLPG